MEEQRRNPEILLAQLKAQEKQEEGGKLKIFLGAAPGVGKTYAMLQEGSLRKNQGVDVVVGLVETHGRQETGKLLSGLEVLPKQNIEYKGQVLQEFDLDAAIKRKPGLILVDEMAHTNAPTCRHAKRWQDIQELLNRGIDVFTTLNVQHLESLNDVIQQIIGVKVRETLPDSMLEEAEIELVDLPPDDLLKRLAEGKVYFKEQAKLAIKNFFKKSNLTALRELALRVTAEQVNMDVMTERKFQDTQEMWATTDKLLVCVGPGEGSAKLVRAAKRLANSLHAEWMAVYVDAPHLNLTQEQKDNVSQNLRLAEQLGAETLVVGGDDLVAEIIRVARERNVTKIVISKHVRPQWRNLLKGSLVDQLIRNSGEIDIYVMRADEQFARESKAVKTHPVPIFWLGYIFAALVVAACTSIAFLIHSSFTFSNLIMVYLLGLVIVAGLGRYGPSLFASLASVLALDFFFVPPIYSFMVKRTEYIFTFIVMLVIGNVISYLTIKIRQQAERSRLREKRTYAILALTKELASHRGLAELLQIATQQIAEVFDSEVLALLADQNEVLKVVAGYPKTLELEDKEISVAKWAYDMEQSAGLGTGTLPYSDAIYIPLTAAKATLGVLRIKPLYPKQFFEAEQMDLLKAFINQTALAIEVDRLER
jgi:two-component system, OmpR family, sensor histidine kinase KdpD